MTCLHPVTETAPDTATENVTGSGPGPDRQPQRRKTDPGTIEYSRGMLRRLQHIRGLAGAPWNDFGRNRGDIWGDPRKLRHVLRNIIAEINSLIDEGVAAPGRDHIIPIRDLAPERGRECVAVGRGEPGEPATVTKVAAYVAAKRKEG